MDTFDQRHPDIIINIVVANILSAFGPFRATGVRREVYYVFYHLRREAKQVLKESLSEP